jgi:hypothetical protein
MLLIVELMNKSDIEDKKGLVTCLSVSKDTRDKLAKLGTKDQTFEDIILGLMPKDKKKSEDGVNEA